MDARSGDQEAIDSLYSTIYDELKRVAKARLRGHKKSETLNTTALVHEAYIKLTAGGVPSWSDRAHFFALASSAMRFVLVSYARERNALKRGGGQTDLTLDENLGEVLPAGADEAALDILNLDQALTALAEQSSRLAEIVEYRFFGGLTYEEIAQTTQQSVSTVKRDWRRARTWLYNMMRDDDSSHSENAS